MPSPRISCKASLLCRKTIAIILVCGLKYGTRTYQARLYTRKSSVLSSYNKASYVFPQWCSYIFHYNCVTSTNSDERPNYIYNKAGRKCNISFSYITGVLSINDLRTAKTFMSNLGQCSYFAKKPKTFCQRSIGTIYVSFALSSKNESKIQNSMFPWRFQLNTPTRNLLI